MSVNLRVLRPGADRHRPWPASLGAAFAIALSLASAACGGGGGGSGGDGAQAGALREKPDGTGFFIEEPHHSGHASRPELLEMFWGRLVDVHSIDEHGETVRDPFLRDLVVNENAQSNAGQYRLETNPITQTARLVVLRVRGAPDTANGGTFESLLADAERGMAGIRPKSADPDEIPPFPYIVRNACLVLRFDDLLDDSPESVLALSESVRVQAGYPPTIPFQARITFDPNHGGVADGRFHSTRVLVDLTVSTAEAVDSPVPLVQNSVGVPRSEGLERPNVLVRLPTHEDPGSGQFSVLHNLAGHALDPAVTPPFDSERPTRDVLRAMRSGNPDDLNNGFLLDFNRPRVVGDWPCEAVAAQPASASGFEWSLDLDFTTVCRKAPAPGDIVSVGERFLEVIAQAGPPDQDGHVTGIAVRVLNVAPPQSADEFLGLGAFSALYRGGLSVNDGCWLRFSPAPGTYPNVDVQPGAETTLRFSEPMDPSSADPFDTILTVRGGQSTEPAPTSIVVGRLRPSLDLREVSFVPSLPHDNGGLRDLYHVRIPRVGGITDLAGNELADELPVVEYSIDPSAPRFRNSGIVLRFDSTDELEPLGAADVRGQINYDLARGLIKPRKPLFASSPVDRSVPMVTIMTPFNPGVATPLSPLGSKLQAVWRYADLGWSIRDETRYNLDVVGLSWVPARAQVSSDFFEQFEVRLAHAHQLPDEQRMAPATGGVRYYQSGLYEGPRPFTDNLLRDPFSPQKVMNERSLGYRVDPRDVFIAASGTPLVPFPVNRSGGELVSFTWRDTGVLAVAGDHGAGVPLDSEEGAPLFLENDAGSFAEPGKVPSVGLPLLMEFRCFPSESGIGLNPLAISLASNVSASPNFRAFSTGGINLLGQRVPKNPDLEVAPTGGFNPRSRPPGSPTRRTADNALYLGQLDYVIKVSRAHTIWIDCLVTAPHYRRLVVEPETQPVGTRLDIDFRGADGFEGADVRPFEASGLNAYGDPKSGSALYLHGDPTWKNELQDLDGARYIQLRFSFLNNISAGFSPELSAVAIAFDSD